MMFISGMKMEDAVINIEMQLQYFGFEKLRYGFSVSASVGVPMKTVERVLKGNRG